MPDLPISALPPAGDLGDGDLFAVVQAGQTDKATVEQVRQAVAVLGDSTAVLAALVLNTFLELQPAPNIGLLSASTTELLSASISFPEPVVVTFQAIFNFIFDGLDDRTAAGCVGYLSVDGVQQTRFAKLFFEGDGSNPGPQPLMGLSATVAQQWLLSLSAGAHVFKLLGQSPGVPDGNAACSDSNLLIRAEPAATLVTVLTATVVITTEGGDALGTESGDELQAEN